MQYTYKSYPNSKTATMLSGIGTGMLVVGVGTVIYWLVYNFPDIKSGNVIWDFSTKLFAIFALVFGSVGIVLMLLARWIGKRAEKKPVKAQQNQTVTDVTRGATAEYSQVNEPAVGKFASDKEAEKYLNQQLKQKKSHMVIFIVWVFIMMFGAVMVLAGPYDDTAPPPPFNNSILMSDRCYSYIDMVSDKIYETGGKNFYCAQDVSSQSMVVCLSKADFDKCKPQYDFYLNDRQGEKPRSSWLTGSAKVSTEIEDPISQALGISIEEYRNKFGTVYLDTTVPYVTAQDKEPNQWKGIFWAAVVFLVIFGFDLVRRFFTRKKSINQLSIHQTSVLAANELYALGGLTFKEPNAVKCSKHFIFSKSAGRIIAVSDVLLCYTYGTGQVVTLVVGTKALNKKEIGKFKADSGYAQRLMTLIFRYNPDVLYDLTMENSRKFNAMRKEK